MTRLVEVVILRAGGVGRLLVQTDLLLRVRHIELSVVVKRTIFLTLSQTASLSLNRPFCAVPSAVLGPKHM